MGQEEEGYGKNRRCNLKYTKRALATRKANQLGFKMEVLREAHNMKYPGEFTREKVAAKLGLFGDKRKSVRELEEGAGSVRVWFAACYLFGVTPSEFLMAEIGQ